MVDTFEYVSNQFIRRQGLFQQMPHALPAQRIIDARPLGAGHIKVRAAGSDGSKLQAIAFRAANTPLGEALLRAPGGPAMHLAGTLSLDHWGGSSRVQLRVVDAAAAGSHASHRV